MYKRQILVCNAASNPYAGPMSGISDEQFRKVLDNNVLANHWLIQFALPALERDGGGAVEVGHDDVCRAVAAEALAERAADAARRARDDDRLAGDVHARSVSSRARQAPAMVTPPSATSVCPVTNDAAGEARKTAHPAISSGSAIRPSGVPSV